MLQCGWVCSVPIFDFLHWSKELGRFLLRDGPIVPVEISIPPVLEEHFARYRIDIPAPESGYALIDTGASASAIDEQVFLDRGISPVNAVPTTTPHGDRLSFVYPAKVTFPALGTTVMRFVLDSNLKWTTSGG